jgi:hypothetical protein
LAACSSNAIRSVTGTSSKPGIFFVEVYIFKYTPKADLYRWS